jgi:hypothetical protein
MGATGVTLNYTPDQVDAVDSLAQAACFQLSENRENNLKTETTNSQ